MDESEILQLVADGKIDMDEMDDFRNLSDEMQEKVANGELEMGDIEAEDAKDIL
jgi:hypothetical protein